MLLVQHWTSSFENMGFHISVAWCRSRRKISGEAGQFAGLMNAAYRDLLCLFLSLPSGEEDMLQVFRIDRASQESICS